MDDPWGDMSYSANDLGDAIGYFDIDTGFNTLADNAGRAFVFHDKDGTRVGCGILSEIYAYGVLERWVAGGNDAEEPRRGRRLVKRSSNNAKQSLVSPLFVTRGDRTITEAVPETTRGDLISPVLVTRGELTKTMELPETQEGIPPAPVSSECPASAPPSFVRTCEEL